MINEVTLLGNLGQTPSRIAAGGPVRLRIATEDFNSETGQVYTNWVTVSVWGKQSENCLKYLQKGMRVYVKAYIRERSWTDDESNKRYATDIVARRVIFPPKPKSPADHPEGPGAEGGER